MTVVAEGWRDNGERRGKIFCRPKMAFVRESRFRRVARQSPQSWAPSLECRSRAPTNAECRRLCPVRPAAEPDNREFLAPEMQVLGGLAHIRGSNPHAVSNRCARYVLPVCQVTLFLASWRRNNVRLPQKNVTSPISVAPSPGIYPAPSGRNTGQFCPTARTLLCSRLGRNPS